MNRSHTTLGLLAIAALFVPATARAAAFTSGQGCAGSTLHTCAAVQVTLVPNGLSFSMGAMSAMAPSSLPVQIHTIRSAETSGAQENAFFVTGCPGHPADPTDCPPTVAPEPISMTLLATGLVGITGFGAAGRRRRKQQRDA